ncbi:L-lysine 6-monooxygenase (NADPH) [Methylocella silvestris BL2]|uniref:L-lysine 6-monooxygenase (NADPH) n=1 Tax=Methylocella silvestris (strain DSM 15510 / CIP 108128 / LMG 27833 / NCIMB 13906 / BL2) TaxID=395965 RepID=B8EQL1_METSB|nr:lysine N(6)-hydroxylase/L-ornithine N(5)-oxygenase family protein [Methylocella silvestris]ACK52224.1 L-lysine 6-monooxygenase (NADPH) [Methylocella silvestris BL2]
MTTEQTLDLAGIGVGPFNLSLAAHLDSIPELDVRFFEQRDRLDWHPGLMLPNADLQTSFLKDLVTATHPTSPWSFLAYLVAQKRFLKFLNAEFEATPRREFANYLEWAANGLPNLQFNTRVREISFDRSAFKVRFDEDSCSAQHIALGIGLSPFLPAWADEQIGDDCFHSSTTTRRLDGMTGERIVVVGGGQSGAEIMLHLLSEGRHTPAEIRWVSRRPNFEPLDATPFTNELFTPEYVDSFRRLGEDRRHALVASQKLAADGASASTLRALYRRIYAMKYLEDNDVDIGLLPHRDVIEVDRQGKEFKLVMRNGFDGGIEVITARTIILATGYTFKFPEFLAPLKDRISIDRHGNFILGDDFSVKWDGPRRHHIFALNAGRSSYGVAEPQLSLTAWRSAVIVNALLRKPHFDLSLPPSLMRWSTGDDVYVKSAGGAVSIAG